MKLRLCLKDKSSVIIENTFKDINFQISNCQFIKVKNVNSGKIELYNRDFIWCVRIHTSDNE